MANSNRDELAIDALIAACCRSGELDPEMTEAEAVGFAASVDAIMPEDEQAIGGNVLENLGKLLKVRSEEAAPLGDLNIQFEPTYAIQVEKLPHPSADAVAKGRKRLNRFLGEIGER